MRVLLWLCSGSAVVVLCKIAFLQSKPKALLLFNHSTTLLELLFCDNTDNREIIDSGRKGKLKGIICLLCRSAVAAFANTFVRTQLLSR